MKNIAKIIYTIVLVVISSPLLFAENQVESMEQSDRRVDVSREYTPEMQRANKLYVEPDMVDTMALRPELDYTIYPNAWRTGFGVVAINPVQMSAAQFDPRYPFYLKVGGGFPAQSILDFYASSQEGRVDSISAYINHYGQYAKIKNDIGFKKRALHTTNDIGLLGKLNTGVKTTLDIGLGFEQDVWSRYGDWTKFNSAYFDNYDFLSTVDDKSPLLSYSTPRAHIAFGNDFSDLSFLNFSVGAGGYMIQDRNDNREQGVDAFLKLGKMFGVHKLMLDANFRGTFGAKDFKGYFSRILTAAPRYGIVTEKFKLDVGADFSYNANKQKSSKLYIFPQAKIEFKVVDWLTPYVVLDGGIINNGMRELTNRNPYMDGDFVFKFDGRLNQLLEFAGVDVEEKVTFPLYDTREYNLRGGVAGSIATNFSYRLYVGATLQKNPLFLYYNNYNVYIDEKTYINPSFAPIRNKRLRTFVIGAEFEGRLSGSFMVNLGFHYYDHAVKSYEEADGLEKKAFGLPEFDASLFLRYNYREKFFLTLGGEFTGKRTFLDQVALIEKSPTQLDQLDLQYDAITYNQSGVFNLSLEAEYRVKRGLGVFVQGNNLTNSKLYRYPHYPDQGISINGGIKLSF